MKNIHQQYTPKLHTVKLIVAVFLLALITLTPVYAQSTTQTKTTAIGTHTIWGTINGVTIEGMVQGPSAEVTDLQIACVFEYTEGDIFNSPPALPAAVNGLVHLDHELKGLLTEMRKNGKFTGHALETILITPPAGTLGAKKILLIGLGDRNAFTPDLMITIGRIATREAVRLEVDNFAFASDLKDAGIDSPTAQVAENITKGCLDAYRTELWLKDKKMANFKPLKKITLLAGPAFYTIAGEGIKKAVLALNQ